jgi:hypothetical protein
VSCLSRKDCLAVGIESSPEGGYHNGIAIHWNGATWTALTPPEPPYHDYSGFTSVSCATGPFCVVIGNDYTGTLIDVWNGRTWTATPVAAPGKGKASLFDGVTCLQPGFCAAVGQAGPYDSTTGTELAATWNGRGWHLVG